MSPTSVSSAKSQIEKKTYALPWGVTDGILAVALSIVLPVVLALLLFGLGRIGLIPQTVSRFLVQDSPTAQVGQYLIALLLEAGIIGGLVWFRKAQPGDLGLKGFKWRWLIYTVTLYIFQLIVVYIAYTIVKTIWPVIDVDQVQDVYPFGHAAWGVWLSFATSVLVAPVVEETLFRGILFGSLTKRFSAVWAALISSIVFGLLHGQTNVIIYTFFLGLILCWLYKRSGSIVPGILLHLLNNIIAFWAITGGR